MKLPKTLFFILYPIQQAVRSCYKLLKEAVTRQIKQNTVMSRDLITSQCLYRLGPPLMVLVITPSMTSSSLSGFSISFVLQSSSGFYPIDACLKRDFN